MTNESLRNRLNVKKENHSQVSRIIKLALKLEIIKKKDPYLKSTKYVSYVPSWA
jgi:predicted HTH transcriptional regulator